jgi:hypothetical protein
MSKIESEQRLMTKIDTDEKEQKYVINPVVPWRCLLEREDRVYLYVPTFNLQ